MGSSGHERHLKVTVASNEDLAQGKKSKKKGKQEKEAPKAKSRDARKRPQHRYGRTLQPARPKGLRPVTPKFGRPEYEPLAVKGGSFLMPREKYLDRVLENARHIESKLFAAVRSGELEWPSPRARLMAQYAAHLYGIVKMPKAAAEKLYTGWLAAVRRTLT